MFEGSRISKSSVGWWKCRWILALLLPLFASCGDGSLHNKIEIAFWNGFTGPDGRTMLQLVRQFNEANPDVRVTMQRMDWITYYNKLFVAGLGERSPEVFIIHTDALPRFVDAGFLKSLDALIAAGPDFPVKDFDATPWNAATQHGKQYAVPLDVHPIGMFFNEDTLVAKGFVDAEGHANPPQDRDGFLRLLRSVHDGNQKNWGAVIPQYRNLVLSLMKQNGGEFFNADNSKCLLASEPNAEALQFLVDLIRRDELIPSLETYSYFDAWIAFRQGKAATTFEGVFMLGDLRKEEALHYASAPLPLFFQKRATFAGSHNLCISADADEEHTEASWRFIRFLSDHSLEWADAGQVPARQSVRASDAFAKMKIQSAFAEQIPYIFYAPQVPFVFEFMTELDLAIEQAVRGRMSAADALRQAATHVDEIIARSREAS